MKTPKAEPGRDEAAATLVASGAWTAAFAKDLEQILDARAAAPAHWGTINVAGVDALDTFGAWTIEALALGGGTARAVIEGASERNQGLLAELHRATGRDVPRPKARASAFRRQSWLSPGLSQLSADLADNATMLGRISLTFLRAIRNPAAFRLTSIVHHLDRVGFQAVPIILVMTFLMGCIIAQQGFFHFRRFGAEDYVVDLVAVLVLREIGVLLVAIMVAGRSGSAYTAELGSMKMQEEIDALRTMGFDPSEFLILPRILALIVATPILTFLGSLSALLGGGVVAMLYGDMGPAIYIARLSDTMTLEHFEVGMFKAPFMALAIGLVAVCEGWKVGGSAESLGVRTTTSVVKSIFLVIVLDGLFAVFFAAIGI